MKRKILILILENPNLVRKINKIKDELIIDLKKLNEKYENISIHINEELFFDKSHKLANLVTIKKKIKNLKLELLDEWNNYSISQDSFGPVEKQFKSLIDNHDKGKISYEELFKTLSGMLSLSVNTKEGFVSLSASMGDPLICAIVAKGAQEILQKSVIDYKIKSASELFTFNQKQLDLKKIEFDSLQNKLALFKDSNLNIIDSRFENRLSGMEAEIGIVNAVYQELSKQLEQSKLQVSRDTPVFSVIQPVTIPNVRSAPKRSLMVLIYTFLGFVLGCGFVLTKDPLSQILKEIRA